MWSSAGQGHLQRAGERENVCAWVRKWRGRAPCWHRCSCAEWARTKRPHMAHIRQRQPSNMNPKWRPLHAAPRLLSAPCCVNRSSLWLRCVFFNIRVGFRPDSLPPPHLKKRGRDTSVAADYATPAALSWENPSLLKAAVLLFSCSKQLA